MLQCHQEKVKTSKEVAKAKPASRPLAAAQKDRGPTTDGSLQMLLPEHKGLLLGALNPIDLGSSHQTPGFGKVCANQDEGPGRARIPSLALARRLRGRPRSCWMPACTPAYCARPQGEPGHGGPGHGGAGHGVRPLGGAEPRGCGPRGSRATGEPSHGGAGHGCRVGCGAVVRRWEGDRLRTSPGRAGRRWHRSTPGGGQVIHGTAPGQGAAGRAVGTGPGGEARRGDPREEGRAGGEGRWTEAGRGRRGGRGALTVDSRTWL